MSDYKLEELTLGDITLTLDDNISPTATTTDTITVSLPDYGAAQSTFTLGSDTISFPTGSIDTSTFTYNTDYSYGHGYGQVNIDAGGVTIKEDGDLKIGERSLKEFMDKVEERLAILKVNPELEDKWEDLKKLGEEYRKLEKEILEKEKLMEMLKTDV